MAMFFLSYMVIVCFRQDHRLWLSCDVSAKLLNGEIRLRSLLAKNINLMNYRHLVPPLQESYSIESSIIVKQEQTVCH